MAYQYRGTKTLATEQEEAPEETQKRRRGPGRNPRHGNGCGTHAGYATHKRRGTPVCFPCKLARSNYRKALDEANKEAA